jgi:plasmid stabilization system protein ParE
MIFELVFRDAANWDLEDIQDYYNKISPAITDKFFIEFFKTMDLIQADPQLFQIRYKGVRMALLYRFPYGIHYKQIKNKLIVYRVLHTKRLFE